MAVLHFLASFTFQEHTFNKFSLCFNCTSTKINEGGRDLVNNSGSAAWISIMHEP